MSLRALFIAGDIGDDGLMADARIMEQISTASPGSCMVSHGDGVITVAVVVVHYYSY